MKLLIVDDEVKLCRLIYHLIDWKAMKLESCGFCHDGKQALEVIQEQQPAIVITDIRMPNFSGLELIEAIKSQYPWIYIVIISGYSDFEYAQTAIKFGVEDYLLKPIRQEELQNALYKIIQEEEERQSKLEQEQLWKQQLDHNDQLIKSHFLEKFLLQGNSMDLDKDLDSFYNKYGCNFREGNFQLGVIQFLVPFEVDREKIIPFITEKISNHDSFLYSEYKEYIIDKNPNRYAVLVNNEKGKPMDLGRQIRKIRSILKEYNELFEQVTLFFYITRPVESFCELRELAEQMELANAQRFFYSPYSMIEPPQYKVENWEVFLPDQFIETVRKCIETFRTEQLQELPERLADHWKSRNLKQGMAIQYIHKELIQAEIYECKKYGMAEYEAMIKKQDSIFENSWDYRRYLHSFFEAIIEFLEHRLSSQHKENMRPVFRAKEYISTHYQEALTLEKVGEYIALNPVYFSSLFKKETGSSFVDYVTEVRIEKAKKLLTLSDVTLADIAEQIGFCDMKYFSKLFKKLTGLSPSEYRKLYS